MKPGEELGKKQPFALYWVFQCYHKGKRLPDDVIRDTWLEGRLEFGIGGTKRYPFETASLCDSKWRDLVPELERVRRRPV